jgi:hypothetical protein
MMDTYRVGYELQLRLRRRLPALCRSVQSSDRGRGRRPVRDAGIQPVDSRRPQERNRLGEPPYGKNSFARKPSGVIGTSPGKIGTAVGQQHLRSILAFCNSPLMNAVEAYIQFEKGLITDEGEVTNAETAKFLGNYMSELHCFIVRCYMVLPRSVGART